MKKKVKEFYLNDQGQLVDAKERSNATEAQRDVSVNENVNTIDNSNNENINNSYNNQPITRETIIRETYLKDNQVIDNNVTNEEVRRVDNVRINPVRVKEKKKDVVLVKDFDEDSKLVSNPFFYDYSPEIEDNIHTISSIEDFYIQRKKKYYNFSYLVRTNEMSLYKRKKILRSGMKTWYNEIVKRLSDVSTYGSSQFQTAEKKIGRANNFVFSLVGVIAIIIALILLNGKIWIFYRPARPVLLILTYVAVIASFFSIMMLFLIDRSIVNVKRLYNSNRMEYHQRRSELEKEFKKKFQYTYNYYVKGAKRKFKKPVLLLDKTAIGELKIQKVENVIVSNNRKFLSAGRASKRLAFPKFILNSLSVLSCAYVFLYGIYQIAVYFIRK